MHPIAFIYFFTKNSDILNWFLQLSTLIKGLSKKLRVIVNLDVNKIDLPQNLPFNSVTMGGSYARGTSIKRNQSEPVINFEISKIWIGH